jgi:hypothetical protein
MDTLKEQELFVKGSSAESLKLGLHELQTMIKYDAYNSLTNQTI